jgi:hypothetical protein
MTWFHFSLWLCNWVTFKGIYVCIQYFLYLFISSWASWLFTVWLFALCCNKHRYAGIPLIC